MPPWYNFSSKYTIAEIKISINLGVQFPKKHGVGKSRNFPKEAKNNRDQSMWPEKNSNLREYDKIANKPIQP
jgi:hypothetical protein